MKKWNNEINTTLTVVTPLSLMFPTQGPTIFLAGSIDGGLARPWQKQAIKHIDSVWNDVDIMILNPRRDVDHYDEQMETEQHAWGISMLEMCDYILMHLCGGGGPSPISLLELGLYMKSDKLFLSIDQDYPKKYAVQVHYTYYTKKQIYDSLFDSIDAIKMNWVNKQNA